MLEFPADESASAGWRIERPTAGQEPDGDRQSGAATISSTIHTVRLTPGITRFA
jgi:hypothetical protein